MMVKDKIEKIKCAYRRFCDDVCICVEKERVKTEILCLLGESETERICNILDTAQGMCTIKDATEKVKKLTMAGASLQDVNSIDDLNKYYAVHSMVK